MIKNLFFNYEDYKLEKFQLENLATSMVPFTFFSLDPIPKINGLEARILSSIKYSKSPFEELEKIQFNKENPLVFICLKGKKSQKAVKKAVSAGFKNVYFIEGGLESF